MINKEIRFLASVIQNNSHTDYCYKKGWYDEAFYCFKPIILNQIDFYNTDEEYQCKHIGLYYVLQRILSEKFDFSNLRLSEITINENDKEIEWTYDFEDIANEKIFRISINPQIISNTIVKAYDEGTFFEVKSIREAMDLYKEKYYEETVINKICDKVMDISCIIGGIAIFAMFIILIIL